MKINDKVKIIYYNDHCDEDLLKWASQQPTDIFKITEIDYESNIFFIENCEYGISFDSDDYILLN